MRHSRWLADVVSLSEFGALPFAFDWHSIGYFCRQPWYSAMAQGLALSVFARMEAVEHTGACSRAAKLATNPLAKRRADGGVSSVDKHGCVWLEEYACERSGVPLNGFLYALFGLREAHDILGISEAGGIFTRAVVTLEKHISDFEIGIGPARWSRYDNKYHMLATPSYHRLHIRQLEWLCASRGMPHLTRAVSRFRKGLDRYESSSVVRALTKLADGLANQAGRPLRNLRYRA